MIIWLLVQQNIFACTKRSSALRSVAHQTSMHRSTHKRTHLRIIIICSTQTINSYRIYIHRKEWNMLKFVNMATKCSVAFVNRIWVVVLKQNKLCPCSILLLTYMYTIKASFSTVLWIEYISIIPSTGSVDGANAWHYRSTSAAADPGECPTKRHHNSHDQGLKF